MNSQRSRRKIRKSEQKSGRKIRKSNQKSGRKSRKSEQKSRKMRRKSNPKIRWLSDRGNRSAGKYHGMTYLSEQAFLIGTIPIRLIPFGMRLIDGVDHILFHIKEPPYRMKKGIINFLLNYGYNIIASPLEFIPLIGHGMAKGLEHALFFEKKVPTKKA